MTCGGDISHRNLLARFCEACYNAHESQLKREREQAAYADPAYRKRYLEDRRQKYRANREGILRQQKTARATKMGIDLSARHCIECGGDISQRTLKAEYCKPCYQAHEQELNRARANRVYADRRDEKIAQVRIYIRTPRGRAKRQAWLERNPTYMRTYKREAHRQKVGYNPDGRTCQDCDADISHRGHNAKWCQSCLEKRFGSRFKVCSVCGADFLRKRARAPFCSRACSTTYRRECRRQEYEALTREWRESRTCAKCATSIAHLSSSAKHCLDCSESQRKASALRGVHAPRARKMGQLGKISLDVEAKLLEFQGHRCAAPWCGVRISKKACGRIRKFELDHVMPLKRRGLHDDKNLQLLCYSCHRKKGAKHPEAWYREPGYLGIVISPLSELRLRAN